MYLKFLFSASLLSLLFSGCSLLKPHHSDEQMHTYLFNKFDQDKNGLVTKAEYMDFIDERFVKMDTDKNGTITREDLYSSRFYTYLPELSEAVFRDSDTDKNGMITKEEMVEEESVRFETMDVNGDGELTADEFIVNDMSEFRK